MSGFKKKHILFCILIVSSSFGNEVFAEKIEFPSNELALESTLPVFENSVAVKNKNVELDGKFELGVFGGALLNEPFFSPVNIGGMATYYLNEVSGLNLSFHSLLEGDSSFKKQLETDSTLSLNLTGAPSVTYIALMNYQYTAWYGKISLTKQTVSNLHFFLLAGGGVSGVGGVLSPTISLGFGEKFYLGKSFAIRFDFKGLVYHAPDPLSVVIPVGGPVPDVSTFEKSIFTNLLVTLAFSYIL